jgi:hypothetical protein
MGFEKAFFFLGANFLLQAFELIGDFLMNPFPGLTIEVAICS